MKKCVLFVSAGRSDLKLLTAEQQRYASVEISKNTLRCFHQWLLDHPDCYTVVHQGHEAMALYQKPQRNRVLDVSHKNGKLIAQTEISDDAIGETIDLLVNQHDRCIVVPVKLGRIIAALQQRVLTGQLEIVAAVVFNTWRDADSAFAEEEPFACGPVLAKWLADCFQLRFDSSQKPKPGKAVWINLLQANEKKEGENDSVNPLAVNRLIDALTRFSGDRSLHAVLCGIGGIPHFKHLIRDSTFFYFNQRCEIAEDSEYHQANDQQPLFKTIGYLHVTAEQSFALRAHVEQLIMAGDFLGAEAAIRHIRDKHHEAWTLPIRAVATLLRGLDAREFPITDTRLDALIQHIQNAKVRCLLPALRTESALQGGRYVEAINSTSVFIDAAKWDGIAKCLNSYGRIIELDEFARRVVFSDTPEFPAGMEQDNNGKRAIMPYPNAKAYKVDTMGVCEGTWLKAIHCPALMEINTLINSPDKNSHRTPYLYRNINTHGVLKADDLLAAQQAFVAARLWKAKLETDNAETLLFLSGPLVAAVLNFFGEHKANEIYRNLVRLLRQNMRSFHF